MERLPERKTGAPGPAFEVASVKTGKSFREDYIYFPRREPQQNCHQRHEGHYTGPAIPPGGGGVRCAVLPGCHGTGLV